MSSPWLAIPLQHPTPLLVAFLTLLVASLSIKAFVFSAWWLIPPLVAAGQGWMQGRVPSPASPEPLGPAEPKPTRDEA